MAGIAGRGVGIALCLAAALAPAVAGCSDDGDGNDDDPGGTTEVDERTTAPGVVLDATVRLQGDEVLLSLTLGNEGERMVGTVDPARGGDRLTPLGDGAFRVDFLRAEAGAGEGGDDVLPPLSGLAIAPGESREVDARVLGHWEQPPTEVEVCVEVVTDHVDEHDGAASFPYRKPGEPPTVACSGPVRLP